MGTTFQKKTIKMFFKGGYRRRVFHSWHPTMIPDLFPRSSFQFPSPLRLPDATVLTSNLGYRHKPPQEYSNK